MIPTMETVALVDHTRIQEEPASLRVHQESEVPVTGMVALVPHLLQLVTVGAVVAMVDLGAVLVQAVAVAPLGLMGACSPRLVPRLPVVEVGVVVPAIVPAVGMVEVLLAVEVQAIPPVVGGMDPTVLEAPPLDVEVGQGDIQVLQVEVIVLHSLLQVEGDIPMAPHHHKTVSHHPVVPAIAKEAMIPRPAHNIDMEQN